MNITCSSQVLSSFINFFFITEKPVVNDLEHSFEGNSKEMSKVGIITELVLETDFRVLLFTADGRSHVQIVAYKVFFR